MSVLARVCHSGLDARAFQPDSSEFLCMTVPGAEEGAVDLTSVELLKRGVFAVDLLPSGALKHDNPSNRNNS